MSSFILFRSSILLTPVTCLATVLTGEDPLVLDMFARLAATVVEVSIYPQLADAWNPPSHPGSPEHAIGIADRSGSKYTTRSARCRWLV